MSTYKNKINKRLKRKAQLHGAAQSQHGISGFGPRTIPSSTYDEWLGEDISAKVPGTESSFNKKTQFESSWTRREDWNLKREQQKWDWIPTTNRRPTKETTMEERNKKQTWLSQG